MPEVSGIAPEFLVTRRAVSKERGKMKVKPEDSSLVLPLLSS
jgi:hypothetical protein